MYDYWVVTDKTTGRVLAHCGEEADAKCVECGDLYCSRTWMGNPGCWATTHAKGNKTSHKTVTLESLKPKALQQT